VGQPTVDQGDVRACAGLPLPVPGAGRRRGRRPARPAVAAALVTGASRRGGIAAAVARALAEDGWSLALTGWRPHDEREGFDADAEALTTELAAAWHEDDLSDPGAPVRILDAAESAVGPLTALVCCHTHSETGGLLEATPEQIDRHLAVSARGSLLLVAEFARRFRAGPGTGRVVVYTSGLPLAGEIAYAAGKGALEWLAVSAAAELAPRGITVNAIDPGPTETGWISAELRERLLREAPLGRLGRPVDSASLVAFLCSDRGGFVTGQVLRCDGGWSTLRAVRHGRDPE
jgi:3-oxoacyl-[acyl-carrier protein] reductase